MIRVVVADDHHLVREGIVTLLNRSGEIEVVGEASDGAAALALVAQAAPDVLVLDLTMPGVDGLEVLRRLSASASTVSTVILSVHAESALVQEVLAAGARGFVPKAAVTEELILAIRAARHGASYLSPAASAALLQPVAPRPSEPAVGLSQREREVLAHVAAGLTSRAIAAELGLSVKTVERHRSNLMAKLGVGNVVDLLRTAIRLQLIDIDRG
ncbi:MAG: response regulator transcription factor [Caldilineae bacterium]|nr:response regulator transcription factor [Caldilineae bacterium]